MAMVQNPDSTEYDGMPRSAIATGLVDYELPPAEMASQLMSYNCLLEDTQSVFETLTPKELEVQAKTGA